MCQAALVLLTLGTVFVIFGLIRLVTGGPKAGQRGIAWHRGDGFSTRLSGTPPQMAGRVRLVSAGFVALGVALIVVAVVTRSR